MAHGMSSALSRVERYLDATPRTGADPEEIGPFTLFRSRTPWPYYARPRRGEAARVTASDVRRLRERCTSLGIPCQLEWVAEVTPSLAEAAADAGLVVTRHALLAMTTADFAPVRPPDGYAVRFLGAEELSLLVARATAEVAFRAGGTATGPQGAVDRDGYLAETAPAMAAHLVARAVEGLTITAAALDSRDGIVSSGSHQPVDDASEIVGVATLPAWRRRGLGAAVTSALVRDAFDRGAALVVLSADSDDVARVYERLGFTRIGTAAAAEAPDT